MATSHLHVRDARDRLIDLLKIGQTYPLRDLTVRAEQLTVAFNTSAKIPIEPSQLGMVYQLHDKDTTLDEHTAEQETGSALVLAEVHGNGDRVILETPRIQEDVTFAIYAKKLPSGKGADLWQTATVKVGLDVSLQASILTAPRLDPTIENPTPTDPRIIPYGTSVDVEIKNSQEGVDYRLVSVKDTATGHAPEETELSGLYLFQIPVELSQQLDQRQLSTGLREVFEENKVALSHDVTVAVEVANTTWILIDRDTDKTYGMRRKEDHIDIYSIAVVRGNLGDIIVSTRAVFEDTDIHIRAIKTFDPEENRPTRTELLNIVLPLKVRANPALPVSVEPAIVDFNKQAAITIANTQHNARYHVFIRQIPDRDIVHTTVPASEVFTVSVEGKPNVQVRKPPRGEAWVTPDGYRAVSEFQPGSGGEIRFVIDDLTDDSMVIVQAQKEHQARAVVPSAVQLEQAAILLVRPNPAPPLTLQAVPGTIPTDGVIQVAGGQPGVLYAFRVDPHGEDIGRPVYFHKQDEADPTVNKGIDQLTLEVDFIVAQDLPPEKTQALPDPAHKAPEPPIVEIGSLQSGTLLYVRAIKAQTGLSVEINKTFGMEPSAST